MPKKKIGKHLQFYIYCMRNDSQMPKRYCGDAYGGLCNMVGLNLISKKLFNMFSYGQKERSFWACGERNPFDKRYKFTPLRQTIVLFMAALNNEL